MGKAVPTVPEVPSSAPSELESIVEPLEHPEDASGAEIEPEAESEVAIVPAPEPSDTAPVQAEAPPPTVERVESAPVPADQAPLQSKAPAVLKSVAPEIKLDNEKIEIELLRLINSLRAEVGAEPLGVQDDMRFAARIRSLEALTSFSHTRPDGTPYNTAFDEADFSYAGKWHGENLSSLRFTTGMFDEKSAALKMFTGLKESPGHYQNMIGANFFQAGIGVSISYDNGVVDIASSQLFSSL